MRQLSTNKRQLSVFELYGCVSRCVSKLVSRFVSRGDLAFFATV